MESGTIAGRRAGATLPATWIVAALLAISALVMWLPALRTPFWGDDYLFLLKAQAEHLSAAPGWSDFWPQAPVAFWRPLSQGGYWRLMLACFGGSAVAMHAANLVLLALACGAVGVLALALGQACGWTHPRTKAALAGAIYASLALHMLPVHWASAANSTLLVLFTALALAAFVAAADARRWRRNGLLACVPLLQALALVTKESAVLLPLLLLLAGLFANQRRWRRGEVSALVACAVLVMIWLPLDARFTAHTDRAYALTVGVNVVRNAAALVAWLLNVPREAVRMTRLHEFSTALAWIAATALPVLAAWWLALRRGHGLLSRRQWLIVIVFVGLAYGPYFLFAWNSYAYYAAVAAIVPVIVLAQLAFEARRSWPVALLIAMSAWIAVAGTRHADQPALLARARWGEQLLTQLQRQAPPAPLWVQIHDPRRFYAVGKAGLSWRLGLPSQAIHVTRHCPVDVHHCLVIDENGQARWRQTPGATRVRAHDAHAAANR